MRVLPILFVFLLAASACKKDTVAVNHLQFSATIDDSTVVYEQTNQSRITHGIGFNYDTLQPNIYASGSGFFLFEDTDHRSIALLTRGNFIDGDSLEDFYFFKLFSKGQYNFVSNELQQEGFKFQYYDSAGNEWATNMGSGNQTNSKIEITDVQVIEGNFRYDILVSAKFNCTLYNKAGQSKELKNGLWQGLFRRR